MIAAVSPGLAGALPFLLAGTVLLAAALLLWIASAMKRAREAAEFETTVGAPEGGEAADGSAPARPAPGVDLEALHARLRKGFAAGLDRVHDSATGPDWRYAAPWVLVVGESGAGKSAALAAAGLERPFDPARPGNGPAPLDDPCRFEVYDGGVALDVKGDLFLRPDGSAYEDGWRHLLKLLARHRPARPVDGVVVAVPAQALRGGAAAREGAVRRGAAIFERLREAQKALGVRFPVYLLVTRCDALPGFASLAAQLPEEACGEAFGWASPHAVDAAFRGEWIDEGLAEVHGELLRTQAELLADSADPDGLFQLPGEIRSLAPGLRALLEEVFKDSAFHESFFFRGFYFTGSADPLASLTAAPSSAPADSASAEEEDGERMQAADPALARPVFLRDLLGGKVFAERNLARRGGGAGMTRDRTVLAAQAAIVFLGIVGGLGLWRDHQRLQRRDAEVARQLDAVGASLSGFRGEMQVLTLLDQVAAVNPRPLYSVFMPTSWPDGIRLRHGVRDVAAGALSDVVLPAMYDSLVFWLNDMAPARGARTVAFVPGGSELRATPDSVRGYLRDMAEVAVGVRRYNTLATPGAGNVALLDSLVRYVFDEGAHRPPMRRNRLLEGALRESRARQVTGSYTRPALDSLTGLAEATYDRLLDQVEGLRDDVESARSAGPGGLPLDTWRRMRGRVDSVRTYVGTDWLTAGGGLPATLDSALRAIPRSAVLDGPGLRQSFAPRFREIRDRRLRDAGYALASLSGSIDPQQAPDAGAGPGAGPGPRDQAALDLRRALDELAGRRFTRRVQPAPLRAAIPGGAWPRWDVRVLDDALGMYADHQAFRAGRVDSISGGAQALVSGLSLVELEASMTEAVARARRFERLPAAVGLPARERELRARVAEFRPAADRLLRLMAAFDTLGLHTPYDELAETFLDQSSAMLGDAAQLLVESGPYAPLDPQFAGWRGSKPVAPAAFGVQDADELEAYLAQQRDRVSAFAHGIAAPLLADFESPAFARYDARTGVRGARGPNELVRWRQLVGALDGYESKAPGNTLVALEQFIRTGMDAVDLGACDASLGRRRAPTDLFSQVRERLRAPLLDRCRELGSLAVVQGYERLRAAFEGELAGRFPFAAPGEGSGDADLDAIRRFWQVWDETGWARAAVAGGGVGVGGAGSPAAEWLAAMERVRPFLAALLGSDTTGSAAFVVSAEFRSNRARERGGDQVADWLLEVGDQRLSPRDSAGARAEWRLGDPVRLSLRWALDSPVRPSAAGLKAPARSRDRTVSWPYGGDWALLRMVADLLGSPADVGASPARVRHTLALLVPTEAVVGDSVAPADRARVFVRLRLRDPGSGAERAMPAFPAHAPVLRGGVQQRPDEPFELDVAGEEEDRSAAAAVPLSPPLARRPR